MTSLMLIKLCIYHPSKKILFEPYLFQKTPHGVDPGVYIFHDIKMRKQMLF